MCIKICQLELDPDFGLTIKKKMGFETYFKMFLFQILFYFSFPMNKSYLMNNILPAYSSNSSSQYVLSTKTLISSKTFLKKWFPTEVEIKCPIGWNIYAKILNQFWDKRHLTEAT